MSSKSLIPSASSPPLPTVTLSVTLTIDGKNHVHSLEFDTRARTFIGSLLEAGMPFKQSYAWQMLVSELAPDELLECLLRDIANKNAAEKRAALKGDSNVG